MRVICPCPVPSQSYLGPNIDCKQQKIGKAEAAQRLFVMSVAHDTAGMMSVNNCFVYCTFGWSRFVTRVCARVCVRVLLGACFNSLKS